ncbi:MAG TPA: DNA-binding transcriptional regulator OxyR [Cytophagales bacterium]|jgi:LysR family transcriptional regulator, hydrogen peroxide-inducible genes activator|nr:DNA-binding transcriptional regulator OxyR [Cytophagales bacterium]
MNIQQLEYIVAVDKWRHFSTAAEKCNVTQPTLSMMIQRLEKELDVKIFDRSKQPVVTTEIGQKIVDQARTILSESAQMKQLVSDQKREAHGDLHIGIIPTVAPYLVPLFVGSFLKKYPNIKLKISEFTTDQIVQQLEKQHLDAGILATPLKIPSIKELPLFYEQFVVYASPDEKLMKKKYLLADDIDVNHLWLLEEGHCLREQVVNLCELKRKETLIQNFDYQAGSIETLKKMVDVNHGITILPELAIPDLSAKQKKNVRYFKAPAPVREVSIVTYRYFIKYNLIEVLRKEILSHLPEAMRSSSQKQIAQLV